jgi:membrane-associated phospholipid phosphatase
VTWPWFNPRRRTFLWLVLGMAGCVAAFALVYWFAVQTITGRQLADAALRGALITQPRAASAVEATLDVVTVTALIAAAGAIAVVALIRMRRTSGLVAVGLLVAANISGQVLKSYILPRPDLGLAESAPATLNSLPSGHTTAAFSIGVAALFVVPALLRWATAIVGIAFSSTVAIATMSAGWHRVEDTLASFFLVTFWALAACGVTLLAQPAFMPAARRAAGQRQRRTRPWLVLTILGLSLLAVLIVAVLVSDQGVRESSIGRFSAFLAGCLLIVGAAAATTAVVVRAVSRVSDAGTAATGSDPDSDASPVSSSTPAPSGSPD